MAPNNKTRKCEPCSAPNCVSCYEDAARCTDYGCAQGYAFSAASGLCEACQVEGCLFCDEDPARCSAGSCAAGHFYEAATNTCAPCPGGEGCEACDLPGAACERCRDGFYMRLGPVEGERTCVQVCALAERAGGCCLQSCSPCSLSVSKPTDALRCAVRPRPPPYMQCAPGDEDRHGACP